MFSQHRDEPQTLFMECDSNAYFPNMPRLKLFSPHHNTTCNFKVEGHRFFFHAPLFKLSDRKRLTVSRNWRNCDANDAYHTAYTCCLWAHSLEWAHYVACWPRLNKNFMFYQSAKTAIKKEISVCVYILRWSVEHVRASKNYHERSHQILTETVSEQSFLWHSLLFSDLSFFFFLTH